MFNSLRASNEYILFKAEFKYRLGLHVNLIEDQQVETGALFFRSCINPVVKLFLAVLLLISNMTAAHQSSETKLDLFRHLMLY